MKCYNVPFLVSRQATPGNDSARAPLSSHHPIWSHALIAAGILHLALALWIVLPHPPEKLTAPEDPGVEMVFQPPAIATPPQPAPVPPALKEVQPPPPAAPPQPVPLSPAEAQPPAPMPSARTEAEPPSPSPVESPAPLPLPPPPPPSVPRRVIHNPSPRATAKPVTTEAPVESRAPASATQALAASTPASTKQPAATPGPDWRRAVASWLAAHKTYPDAARTRGIEGSVSVRITIDATGQVTAVTILQGSGSAILDSAAEALLRNASLPPPGAGPVAVSLRLNYKLTD